MQSHPVSSTPPRHEVVQRPADSASWPSGHILGAFVLMGLVGALRVGHALSNREVFGFEATTALLALIWWPFVLRDLLGPRWRRWRAHRRAQRDQSAGSAAPLAAAAASTGKPSMANVIRIADRRRPRPEAP